MKRECISVKKIAKWWIYLYNFVYNNKKYIGRTKFFDERSVPNLFEVVLQKAECILVNRRPNIAFFIFCS